MKRRTVLSAVASVGLVQAFGAGRASAAVGLAPTTAAGFFQMFQDKNDMDWSSGDQATSFKCNGFIYWLFGDTMLGAEDPDGSFADGTIMIGNRILLQEGDAMVNAMATANNSPAVPNPVTSNSTNGERYWAQGMFYANGFLYVLCQRVKNNNNTFQLVGGEIAKFSQNTTTGKLTLVGMVLTPSTGQPEVAGVSGIQWCNDAVLANGYVYVYGATPALNNGFVTHWSYVARVPAAQLESPSAWRFYKKTTGAWVATIAELDQDATNGPDSIVGSQISSVRWINGKFVMVHKPWNGFGSDVKAKTSLTPYGKWSDDFTIFSSPAGTWEGLNYVTYSPQLHPEQKLASGKTLVSIAWNGDNLTMEQALSNADLYKPRFYEIQF